MSHEEIVYAKYHVEEEGNSVAGWTGVTLIVLGFIIGTVAMFLNVPFLVWVGVALVPIGVIAWMIMRAAGLGPKLRD